MPHVPKPPLYDGRLGKGSEGFVWMSEMTLRDLEWWEAAKRKSADTENQWTERNRKKAATLAKWIEWRRLFPNECWSGKRGDERATAAPPSRDPKVQSWSDQPRKADQPSTKKTDTQAEHEEEESYGF